MYPNIEYVENTTDSTLITNIYLSPKKYGQVWTLMHSKQQKMIIFSSGIPIRNIFKCGNFTISALGAVGASKDGSKTEDRFFDINELGTDIKLNIPDYFSIKYRKNYPKVYATYNSARHGFYWTKI